MRRFSRRYLLIKNLLKKCLKKVLEKFEAGTYKNAFPQDSHQNQNIFNTLKQSSRTFLKYLLTEFFQGPSQGGPQAQKNCPREHPPEQKAGVKGAAQSEDNKLENWITFA